MTIGTHFSMCESELNSQKKKKTKKKNLYSLHLGTAYFFLLFLYPPDSFIENIISLIQPYIITDHSSQSPSPNDQPPLPTHPSPIPWNNSCSPCLSGPQSGPFYIQPQRAVVGPWKPSIKKQLQHSEKEEKEKENQNKSSVQNA